MHLIFLGVVRRMLIKYYIDGKRKPQKMSSGQIRTINQNIKKICSYFTSDFTRKPRILYEIKSWKTTEFRLFILYTCPILLYDILHMSNYNHFILLHCATFIMSNKLLTEKFLDKAQSFLEQFVVLSNSVLNKNFVTYNVHSMLHICDDVKKIWNIIRFFLFSFRKLSSICKAKSTLKEVYFAGSF